MRAITWLGLALAACQLPALDVTGLACTQPSDCGQGLFCTNGACSTDPGSDDGGGLPYDVNLLFNPDFEFVTLDGGVQDWRALAGHLSPSTTAHSNLRGARLEAVTQQVISLEPLTFAAPTSRGPLVCTSMWVTSDIDGGVDVVLSLRERLGDGGLAPNTPTFRANGVKTWTLLKAQGLTFGGGSIAPRLATVSKVDAGLGVFVDEVVLVQPDSGVCP